MDRRVVGIGLLGFALLAGCQGRPDIVYAEWLREPRTETNPNGRFEAYVRAGQMAEVAAPKYLRTVWFTPGKRDACLKQIGPALKVLAEGIGRQELGYRFTPIRGFDMPENAAGWRLLGRGLVWKVEAAVKDGDYDGAIRCTVLATKFGLDLLGGGALEASLGMAISDEARRAVAPALGRMNPQQLDQLAAGLTSALQRKPDLAATIENERLNMLSGVQTLQDAYRADEWNKLVKSMGPDVRSSVDKLRQMKDGDPNDAVKFFQGMGAEADQEARYAAQLAELPTIERPAVPEPSLSSTRPWRRFARHFFGTLRPLLMQHDDTLARTRLLVLEAHFQKLLRVNAPYPKNLNGMPKEVSTDPFTGQQFAYRADGGDCRVYSVGRDLRDDGGQTDDSFSSPDLRLELR